MVLYNVTVGIDQRFEKEWLKWVKEVHIPAVMETGMFTEHHMYKVLGNEEEDTTSYSMQFFAKKVEDVVYYLDNYAPPLVERHMQMFKDKHIAFRTLLEEVK